MALAAMVIMAFAPVSADAFDWAVIKYQGRDYVAMESLHEFYRFQNLKTRGNDVWFSSPTLVMKATAGTQDLFINNVRFILSYPVVKYNGRILFSRLDLAKLIDPVLRPSYIGKSKIFTTVIVDPGHGGHDSGARGRVGREKDYALQLGLQLRTSLKSRGFAVRMTRSDDRFLSLGERVRVANATPNAIFISLHFNSGKRDAHGIETFALSPQGSASTYKSPRSSDARSLSGNVRDSENIALATAIHANVLHKIPAIDRGVKRARWAVLTGINKPAVLFEGGFVTNSTECRKIASTAYRRQLAEAIAGAVTNFRAALEGK
ncbi:MAG: N-acetylmuramoyl-L-alanine amidase [Verrucomicrobiales bacterium]